MHELDTVEIINPTEIDFTEPKGKADPASGKAEAIQYGGHPYPLKAGEKKPYNRFLADHITKHITNYVLRDDPKNYNNEDIRKEWWDKIQIGTVNEFQPGANDTEGAKIAARQEDIAKQQEERMKKLEEELKNMKSKDGKKRSTSSN